MNRLDLLTSTDPAEIAIPRAMLRQLLDLAKTAQILQDKNDVPIRCVGELDREVIQHLDEISGLKQAADDLKFIARHLHYAGEFRNHLTNDEHLAARALCDGFGKHTAAALLEREIAWDWSHVRDSTPEALASCRRYIEDIIQRLPNASGS